MDKESILKGVKSLFSSQETDGSAIDAKSSSGESENSPSTASLEPEMRELIKHLGSIATDAWKLKERITEKDSGETKEEFRRLARNVDGILTSLTDAGVETRDRTGEIYDYGLPERVVASEKEAGINREFVKETIRPTVMWRSQLIEVGEIVIATPITPESTESTESTEKI